MQLSERDVAGAFDGNGSLRRQLSTLKAICTDVLSVMNVG
jgi:hypothetical protein